MSRAAIGTFAGSIAFTAVLIVAVTRDQEEQRARLREALLRDDERRARKANNVAEYAEQQRLLRQLVERDNES